jgi:O-methyltransferase
MYSPAQLAFLCQSVSELDGVDGAIVEVGSAFGDTTVFLNEHMRWAGIERPYFCVDTFSGFTSRDIEDEVVTRGRRPPPEAFRTNKRKWVQRRVGPIAFCLVDVDLYLPVKSVLDRVFDLVSTGGRIVVDDCSKRGGPWDGAYDAYCQFTAERELESRIVHEKLGLIDR